MTPKEKAKDLVDKFDYAISTGNDLLQKRGSRQCALIAVEEIINSNPHSNPLNTSVYSTMQFWKEVKHEIEKL